MKTHPKTKPLDTTIRKAAEAAALLLGLVLAGCGGGSGSGGGAPTAVNSAGTTSSAPLAQAQAAASSFAITADDYGMENATYLSATSSVNGIALRAAVASSMTDPNYQTVSRIDLSDPSALSAGRTYSLGTATASAPAFPGNVYFFNGHQSTMLQTVGGTITFDSVGSSPGQTISGSFTAQVVDGGASAKASYTIAASFSFTTGSFGPVLPAPTPVPAAAAGLYAANCASCHTLGSLNPSQVAGSDLSLKGGELNTLFAAGVAGHKGITLAGSELSALKILLNVN